MNQRCVTGMQTRLLYQSREQSQSNHAPASAHAFFPDEFVAHSQRQRARDNNNKQIFISNMHKPITVYQICNKHAHRAMFAEVNLGGILSCKMAADTICLLCSCCCSQETAYGLILTINLVSYSSGTFRDKHPAFTKEVRTP